MINNPHSQAPISPEPPTTKAALFFGPIFRPSLMQELERPGGLPENGMHMEERSVDVVATYEPVGSYMAGLQTWSSKRGSHLLVVRLRPGFAEDAVFELVFNDRGIITMIGDLALYTSGGTQWFLCPIRGDILHYSIGEMGIEPQVSTPWIARQQRIAGFRDAAVLLAGAVGE